VGDGSFELVGEGQGMNGLPPMVYGCVWNPFPDMEEFITYGTKHIKVWRRVGDQWLGETGLRNDGQRVADVNLETTGSGAGMDMRTSTCSLTTKTLASLGGAGGVRASVGSMKGSVRGSVKGSVKGGGGGGIGQVAQGGESVVSAVYARQDVIITGFPSGALGVWLVTHENNKVGP